MTEKEIERMLEAKQPTEKENQLILKLIGNMAIRLLKFCHKHGFENPAFSVDVSINTGEKYVIKFERVDLDLPATEAEYEKGGVNENR